MGINHRMNIESPAGRAFPVLVALLVTIVFQLCISPFNARAADEKIIWQSREQFVAIVPQDGDSTTPANAQPASLNEDQVRNALSSLVLAPSNEHKQLPVFNEPEIDMLSQHIADALHQAGPREDVTFAIVGHFSSFVEFLKVRQITTGRVFFVDGKLNIIFGIMHRDLKENEDRRLSPLTPGSRTQVVGLTDRIMALPGIQPFSKRREDWLVFDKEGLSTPPVAIEPPQPEVGSGKRTSRPAESAVPAPASAPQKQEPPQKRGNSVEERLMMLNELKNKHLITDEEYRAKRMEILNSL